MVIHREIDKHDPVLVSNGDIYSSSDGGVSQLLDTFALHDSVLVTFSFVTPLEDESVLLIAGVLPDLRHAFRLEFHGYSALVVSSVSIGSQIGVSEMSVTKENGAYMIRLVGELADQAVTLRCKAARFEKYRLGIPLTRSDMGW